MRIEIYSGIARFSLRYHSFLIFHSAAVVACIILYLCCPGVAVNGQQVLEMAASGHPNSVIIGDVVLSMTSLRSDVTRFMYIRHDQR